MSSCLVRIFDIFQIIIVLVSRPTQYVFSGKYLWLFIINQSEPCVSICIDFHYPKEV